MSTSSLVNVFIDYQTCDIQMEGTVRRLILKNCQLDQAGEVSYQALNAVTNAMLNVKGKPCSRRKGWQNIIVPRVIVLAVKIKV